METPQQHVPEVSTEPQRRALDEMSQRLVERLNEMVHEQNERAERFAATQHSLSALPNGQSPLAELPPLDLPEQAITLPPTPQPRMSAPAAESFTPQPAPAPQPEKSKRVSPPPLTTQRVEAQKFLNKPLWKRPGEGRAPSPAISGSDKKAEESGCGSGTIITIIIIVLILIRSCS